MICQPWCTDADLTEAAAAKAADPETGLTPEDVVSAIAAASEVLFALSGRQWTGGGCTMRVEITPGRRSQTTFHERRVIGRMGPQTGARWPYRLRLPASPVTAVTELLDQDAQPVDEGLWRLEDGHLQQLDAGRPVPWSLGPVICTFEFGGPPPPGGVRAAATYASELLMARAGSANRLPARLQSVTRQGVTIAVLDPFDFLDKGRTGIPEIDTWLAGVNPSGQLAPVQVTSPDVPRVHYRTIPTGG